MASLDADPVTVAGDVGAVEVGLRDWRTCIGLTFMPTQ